MNIKEIERLIEKYYEGETSTTEEKILHDFFQKDDVPEHLREHKPLFSYFTGEREVGITNPDFDRLLDSRLDEAQVIRGVSWRSSIYTMTAVAAGLIILVAVMFNFRQDLSKTRTASTPAATQSDQAAFIEARQTLLFVSARFNNGINEIQHLEVFDKGLEQMNKLSSFYQYESLIINPDELQNPSSNSN